jgi:hypothetical protein
MSNGLIIPITRRQAHKASEGLKRTLELPDDAVVSVSLRLKRQIPIPYFVMTFQEAGIQLTKQLKDSTLKTFFLCICKMGYGNVISIDQACMCEETGLSIATVKRALQDLISKNIIFASLDPQDKRRKIYTLNPNIAWRGKAKDRITLIRKLERENPSVLQLNFMSDKI